MRHQAIKLYQQLIRTALIATNRQQSVQGCGLVRQLTRSNHILSATRTNCLQFDRRPEKVLSNFWLISRHSNSPAKPPVKEPSPSPEETEAEREQIAKSFDEELAQLTLYERYKKLFKEYWYVLLPVHGIGSVLWFGGLYLFTKAGVEVDYVAILEKLHLPEAVIKPLRNPNLGSFALALVLYKVVSPARYLTTVTLTVPIIKALVRAGKIKPVPSGSNIRKMIQDRLPTRKN